MRPIDGDSLIGTLHCIEFYDGNDMELVYQVIHLQPTIESERQKGEWITDSLSGLIYCGRCGNGAPMETTGGRQYESNFCPTCGADMRCEKDG